MIDKLASRLSDLPFSGHITPVIADMRSLFLQERFDLILVPQGGFQLLTSEADAEMALGGFRRHLAPQGQLLIDLAVFDPSCPGEESVRPSYYDPSLPDGHPIHEWTRPTSFGETLSRTRIQYHKNGAMKTHFFYRLVDRECTCRLLTHVMTSKIYTHASFLELAHRANLQPISVYKNYKGEHYSTHTAHNASRMIFILESAS